MAYSNTSLFLIDAVLLLIQAGHHRVLAPDIEAAEDPQELRLGGGQFRLAGAVGYGHRTAIHTLHNGEPVTLPIWLEGAEDGPAMR